MDTGVTIVNPAQTMEFTGSESVSNPAPGKATVNVTGSGGGFTKLTATETPDANNRVFTFSAAAAKPSYLSLDGALKPATDADGVTVNWTWNSGAKQATCTVAPNTDIFGIV